MAPPLNTGYGGRVRDDDLPYKPRPFSRATGESPTKEFRYDYQHNSFGFRDVEHTLEKKAATFRILGLGDSFTYGAGVAFDETYLSRLEQMLNRRVAAHRRVEVIKAGIPRFFPEPERILLEKYGVRFAPDLVLVGFLPNDVMDTFDGLAAVTVDPSGHLKTREAAQLGPVATRLYASSHLGRIVLRSYVSWQIGRKYPSRPSDIYRDAGFHEKDWLRVEREYERMAAIAASVGARFVVVHIPQRGPWGEHRRYPAARLSRWAAMRDVGFVDVLPAMERATAQHQRLYYEKDGHCTPAGHAVIAEVLYGYLTERTLVP